MAKLIWSRTEIEYVLNYAKFDYEYAASLMEQALTRAENGELHMDWYATKESVLQKHKDKENFMTDTKDKN